MALQVGDVVQLAIGVVAAILAILFAVTPPGMIIIGVPLLCMFIWHFVIGLLSIIFSCPIGIFQGTRSAYFEATEKMIYVSALQSFKFANYAVLETAAGTNRPVIPGEL